MRRTKIVCTIGPATCEPQALAALAGAGMNVARLNFSHGTHEEHAQVIHTLRALSAERSEPIAILQDLSGPKVRVGQIKNGSVTLEKGSEVRLSARDIEGDASQIPVSIPEIVESVPVGAHLLLDDGLLDLRVIGLESDALVCTVVVGGPLSSHKGVNAPGVSLPIASVTDKDLDDLQFGIAQKVDWIAASFVRNASDMAVLRGVCNASRAKIPLIAKIEKHEAVRNIDEIIAVVDGVMVARGDLGVEIPIDEVPVTQKMIIARCKAAGKPVITATQMLDSMIRNPRPTRAEVSDVANAIFDGTDAVMLSGETAVGSYPLPSVQMMDEIARYTEAALPDKPPAGDGYLAHDDGESITQAIALATCDVARDLKASAIITATSSGRTAMAVSRFRPRMPILAATDRMETYQRLALVWGVYPRQVAKVDNSDHMMEACIHAAQECHAIKEGELVVLTGGVPVGRPGSTNFIKSTGSGSRYFRIDLSEMIEGRREAIKTDTFDGNDDGRERVRPSRRKRRRKRVLGLVPRFLLIAAAVAATAVACFALGAKIMQPYEMGSQQAQQMSQVQSQLGRLDANNAALSRQAAYLRRPDGIEAAARAEGYLRPGEVSLVIEEAPVSAQPQREPGFAARVRHAWQSIMVR